MDETAAYAIRKYVFRCRSAGDRRPLRELLADILDPADIPRFLRYF